MPAPFLNINLYGVTDMTTVVIAIARPKFPLGQIVITANAQAQLDPADVQQGCSPRRRRLGRACPGRRPLQQRSALKHGDRLFSVYGQGDKPLLDHHRMRPLGHDRPHAAEDY